MHASPNPLGDLSPENFLTEYWQKKVLVVRQALPDFKSPLTAEELAGLSCEEEVNSRIVMEKDGEHPWYPIFGPMDDEVFSRLPETHWTLIVNDLEKYVPELAWIVDRFRFIPEWRFDDLMTSYAADQGSVGPHLDLYDVFIIQGQGKRRWQINTQPVATDNQVDNTPLRIQKTFAAEQEWILEPGDMIYIPPNVSHYGVSLGESISYSVGYRATSHADLVNDFVGYITQNLAPQLTYQDPDLKLQKHPNEITPDAIKRIADIFKNYLNPEHPELLKWFGQYTSDTRTDLITEPEQPIHTIYDLPLLPGSNKALIRHPASRFAFSRNHDTALLFIDGASYTTSISFAENICHNRKINLETLLSQSRQDDEKLIIELYNRGKIYIA
ncbi:MAG: cupin domain-containing protein [Gammaproteobacteria bacterium]|nr:cupin domain-containing protein [Gammaproteobacteria bacterium]